MHQRTKNNYLTELKNVSIKKIIIKKVIIVFLITPYTFFSTAQTISPEQFLSEIIQIPSVSGNERKVAEKIIEFCRTQELYVEVFSKEDSSYNFSASLYPLSANKPNILLLSHLDVVPATDSAFWEYPPFSGK